MPQDTGRGKSVAMPMGRPSKYDPDFCEAIIAAGEEGQPSAAVSASMGKAKLHGLLTDKQQTEHSGIVVTEVRRVIVDGKDA